MSVKWENEHDGIRLTIFSAPVLALRSIEIGAPHFLLKTDISDAATGDILLQRDTVENEHVTVCTSTTLSKKWYLY